MQVDTIEKDNDDMLWAYLVWNEKNDDGRFNRTKARLATCNRACPQKMLSFYEKHVYVVFFLDTRESVLWNRIITDDSSHRVFTNNKTNYMQENGAMTA